VCFVDLATVADDRLVPAAAAYGLGMTTPADDVAASLSGFLHDKVMLAVLDNCEHVVEGVVPLVEQLLKSTPGLVVLATSREPLRAEGEWLHRVPGLRMPAEGEAVTASQALEYPALQLFVERAMTTADVSRCLTMTPPVVAGLCHRPTAMRSHRAAAARVGSSGVRGPARQLDAYSWKLKAPRGDGPAPVACSHARLELRAVIELERAILRQLAIFRGFVTLDAALDCHGGGRRRLGAARPRVRRDDGPGGQIADDHRG
jgi:predicted ATPase